jgi:hypothetical protein
MVILDPRGETNFLALNLFYVYSTLSILMILMIRVVGRCAFGTRSGGENSTFGLHATGVAVRALKSDMLAVLSFIINDLMSFDDYWSSLLRRGDALREPGIMI